MISGTPTASAPEMAVFHAVGKPEEVTNGIANGAAKPATKIATPTPNRQRMAGALTASAQTDCVGSVTIFLVQHKPQIAQITADPCKLVFSIRFHLRHLRFLCVRHS
jgi:hypothetical protein